MASQVNQEGNYYLKQNQKRGKEGNNKNKKSSRYFQYCFEHAVFLSQNFILLWETMKVTRNSYLRLREGHRGWMIRLLLEGMKQ